MSPIHQNFIARQKSLESELGEAVSISGIAGSWRIFQRLNGHRHSIDDTTTAWYALQKSPGVKKALDLGTGIGTVGMAVLWGLGEEAKLTCVEAQEISYKLLRANLECNEIAARVSPHHGDLRDLNLGEKFPLITGSPPYFPEGTGVLPEDSQKAYARFELRGDVGDYARAAKRHLAEGGLFVYCFPHQHKARGIKLVEKAGFTIMTAREVVPMRSKPPLFSLYSARLTSEVPLGTKTVEEPPFIVASEDGKYTSEMLELQATRGFGPEGTNIIE